MTQSDDLITEHAAADDEALAHVCRLASGEASVEDVERIKRWRNESVAHDQAFARASLLWKKLGPASQNVLARSDEPIFDRDVGRSAPRWTRRGLLGAAAASVAAGYLAVYPPFQLWPSLSEITAQYRTEVGERRRIAVSNGIAIEMNTRTSLDIQRSENDDHVRLIAGEVAVTIDAAAGRTAIVSMSDGWASARNARLDVRNDAGIMCVTCLAGEVRVERNAMVSELHAGEQVRYQDAGLGPVLAIDPAIASAWQDGLLVFRATPLADVIAEINRYRPGKIVLMNNELGRRVITARFRIGHVEEILLLVHEAFAARVRTLPGGIVMLS